MSVGDNIAYLRRSAGYSQKEFAKKLGVSQAMVCYYEKDLKTATNDVIKKMAKVIGCKKKDLLSTETKKSKSTIEEMKEQEKTILLGDVTGYKLLAYTLIEEERQAYIKALRVLKEKPDDYESLLETRCAERFFRKNIGAFISEDIDPEAAISAMRRFANSGKELIAYHFEPSREYRHSKR